MRNLNKHLIRKSPSFYVAPSLVKSAKGMWADFREERGMARSAPALLTHPEANAKFAHTEIPVYGLSLAPDKSSATYGVCDFSTPECRKGCVAFAGQGEAPNVLKGRSLKTEFLGAHPDLFLTLLANEVSALVRKHGAGNFGVRLNAFSDLEWERICPELFTYFHGVEFYDYTKRPFGSRQTPSNYHLTYSVSERTTDGDVLDILHNGGNVAMVLDVKKNEPMPEYLHVKEGINVHAVEVIDGDASDARYVDVSMGDAYGVVIGLRPKGRMRKFPVGAGHMVKEVV